MVRWGWQYKTALGGVSIAVFFLSLISPVSVIVVAFRFLVSKSSFLLFFYWFFLERREEEETLRLKSVGVLLRQSRCWRPFLSCVYLFDRVSCCERSRYFLVPCLSSQSANSFNRCIIASSIRSLLRLLLLSLFSARAIISFSPSFLITGNFCCWCLYMIPTSRGPLNIIMTDSFSLLSLSRRKLEKMPERLLGHYGTLGVNMGRRSW